MAEKILMLALSPTMEEGVIVKWVKTEGDHIEQGDILCEVETDKATMEYESLAEGTLLKIVAAEEQSVSIGKTIAIIGRADEDISDLLTEETPEEPKAPVAAEPIVKDKMTPATPAKKLRSTPLARKLAKEHAVDIAAVTGTGPEGRITADDIEKQLALTEAVPQIGETIPVTQKRKVIAETLSASKFTAPHYYLTLTATVDDLMQARMRLNDHRDTKVSVNAFLMKLIAETLKRNPMINSTWAGDTIIRHGTADIALAVAQPDGLIAPVVRNCGSKGVLQIDAELKVLIDKTRKGTLSSADYADSTFTISSLGTFGIEEFTAIINPPNSAILAVGAITKTPVVADDDAIRVRRCMKMTLSCDHRLIDGTVGAKFLSDLKEMIEYPVCALY